MRRTPVWWCIGAGLLSIAAFVQSPAASVVTNARTGLAIDGFDPVAYFVEGRPQMGRADFELAAGGGIWRFRNEGNRGAFAADPEVYTPHFGGYDPIAVTRGAIAPGHPELWLIFESRLYLFQTVESRDAFLAHPDDAIDAAERRWPALAEKVNR